MNKIKALIFSAILTLTGLAVLPASAAAAGSASLSLSPSGGSRTVGTTFSVAVVENSGATSVNGVQADLTYSPSLQLLGKSCGGSFEIAAPAGGTSLACATVTPKTGVRTVGSVSFRVVAAGSGSISFQSSSQITASDGQGTNVWNGSANPAGFSLAAAVARPQAAAPATPAPTPAPAVKAVEIKKVAPKVVAPAPKKSHARQIWSGILLAIVLIAALIVFSEKTRKQVTKWGSQVSKKVSASKKATASMLAVDGATAVKQPIKKSANNTTAKKSK